jgi:hypothetical protein
MKLKNIQAFMAFAAMMESSTFPSYGLSSGRGNDIHRGFASNEQIIERMKQDKLKNKKRK